MTPIARPTSTALLPALRPCIVLCETQPIQRLWRRACDALRSRHVKRNVPLATVAFHPPADALISGTFQTAKRNGCTWDGQQSNTHVLPCGHATTC